ncbi:MAG: TetR/AcrR family transcriptional regulator [Sulfuritalea sp.]|nr:TetR/AcrR family transcriptional regulator [Sulfuritalea sp.]MDP1980991.1 TetR/AcrR family transcriptional regulator [Sulfuritalea sp.]
MTTLPETEINDCRARLIQAAAEVFVEVGYRASVERVAARAGVARQTLYNHFPCKADLFGEVVRQSVAALLITLDAEQQPLRERLLRFGVVYRNKILSAEGLGFFRTLTAETVRFPELAASFYRSGPAQTAARLSVVLKEAMTRGELRAAAPEFAANLLLSMLVGADRTHYLFSGEPPPEPNPEHVGQIIDCFLRAFAPEIPAPTTVPQRSLP